MRIYAPATLDLLRDWVARGGVPASAERFVAEAEDDDSEYAALMAAADASTALLPGGAGRRVVVAAEAADPDAEVAWRDVVSVHVDPAERPAGADPDEDLGWYATQEVAALLGG